VFNRIVKACVSQVKLGADHVGLMHNNGQVVISGNNHYGQCTVGEDYLRWNVIRP